MTTTSPSRPAILDNYVWRFFYECYLDTPMLQGFTKWMGIHTNLACNYPEYAQEIEEYINQTKK